jgi:hypothetical protein
VSPVRYELGFYIPEDDILHSHRRENLKSYMVDKLSLIDKGGFRRGRDAADRKRDWIAGRPVVRNLHAQIRSL